MNCAHCRNLLDAFADGEVDRGTGADIEAHLTRCADCRALWTERTELRAMLQSARGNEKAPERIRARVLAGSHAPRSHPTWVQAFALAAGSAAVAVGIALWMEPRWGGENLRDQLVSRHIAALAPVPASGMPVMDVLSSERHEVKPWFQGRVPLSPPVVDVSAEGYELLGGRVDRVGGYPAGVVVYRIRRHPIELFAWRDGDGTSPPVAASHGGFNIVSWKADGLSLAAVSDLNAAELQRFAQAVAAAAR